MHRREFIKNIALTSIAMQTLTSFKKEIEKLDPTEALMPVMFVGHGNPMNAIEDNEYSRTWTKMGKELIKPKAILCVSAHWQTRGTSVTAMDKPKTIHDFGGFPDELFNAQYPAPGSPELAKETADIVKKTKIELDHEWGLDHGAWSVLKPMFPEADIPTFQLSLDYTKPPQYHFELAQELKELRKKGVLIMGSGNIVHNLGLVQWTEKAFDWAIEFDEKIKNQILSGDFQPIVDYKKFGKAAELSIPTNEHYLPLLYTLALKDKKEEVQFFNEKTTMGSISMRSLKFG
jgi:4,5-DOPA dioxygenase extradiol